MNRQQALLLLGPTGSGKTPLGDTLVKTGLWGAACCHLDFGHQLRLAAAGEFPGLFTAGELAVIQASLAGATLLENEHFDIARKIVEAVARDVRPTDWLILNGLPRHLGQAHAVDQLLAIRCVVQLSCTAETVRQRIRLDAGGDREGRLDDSLDAISRKLALYAERTQPLVAHYRKKGVSIRQVDVRLRTQSEAIVAQLEENPHRL